MSDKTSALSELDVPVLEGWVNLTEAAAVMSVSRQYVHKLAQQGSFPSLHKIAGARDTFIVSRDEVETLAAKRAAEVDTRNRNS